MTDAYRNLHTYTVWAKAKQPHGTFKFWSGLNANIFLYVKKEDRKNMSPELADLFLKFFNRKIRYLYAAEPCQVVFHGRKYLKKKRAQHLQRIIK